MGQASRGRIWLGLAVIYVVWGSTYFAIRVAVHPSDPAASALPPLLLAGVRYVLAGALLLAVTWRRPAADGMPDPVGRRQWVAASLIGVALVLGGNGLVSVAEQRIASWVAAVVIATVPIWAALIEGVWHRERVGVLRSAGLALGFAGVVILLAGSGAGPIDAVGILIAVAAAVSWAAGSVWSPQAPLPRRPLVSTGVEMLAGGAACAVAGLAAGEWNDVHLSAVPASAWAAFGYLVVIGSLVAYTSYVWLLGNAPISLVTTYAYVNPLVAVALGTLFLSEPFGARDAVAAATIVAGVALIVSGRAKRRRSVSTRPDEPASPQPNEATV